MLDTLARYDDIESAIAELQGSRIANGVQKVWMTGRVPSLGDRDGFIGKVYSSHFRGGKPICDSCRKIASAAPDLENARTGRDRQKLEDIQVPRMQIRVFDSPPRMPIVVSRADLGDRA